LIAVEDVEDRATELLNELQADDIPAHIKHEVKNCLFGASDLSHKLRGLLEVVEESSENTKTDRRSFT